MDLEMFLILEWYDREIMSEAAEGLVAQFEGRTDEEQYIMGGEECLDC